MQDAVWQEHVDGKSGTAYWHNCVTGKSQWEAPADVWYKCRDVGGGRDYYFNLLRHESTYAEPESYVEEDFSRCAAFPYSGASLGMRNERKGYTGFVPALEPFHGRAFWHTKEQSTWRRPRGATYKLADRTLGDEYEALEQEARTLQSHIHSGTDELGRLNDVADQVEETADARGKRLQKLRGQRRESGSKKTLRQKGVTRYLETSFGRVAMRSSMRAAAPTTDSFLKSVPVFHGLDQESFEVLRKSVRAQTFEPKEVIVRQDTRGELFYLIQEGKVRVYVQGAWSEDQGLLPEDNAFGKFVVELIAGDYFGEKALLGKPGATRTATVVAETHVTAYTLSRDVFLQVIDPDKVTETSNSTLSHIHTEIASFGKHVSNYDCLLALKRKASTQREGRVADALMQLMTAFSPELNVQDTIARMRKTLFAVFACERISLYVVDWESRQLTMQFGSEEHVLPIGQGIAGHCAAINKIINVPHVHKNEHFYGDVDSGDGFVTRSVLCCPVSADDGQVIAVIELINKRGGAPFSEEDEHIVASVSEQMSLTLAQKRAEQSNDFSLLQYLPIWQLDSRLAIKVKRFLGTSLPGHVLSESIIISVSIYYAGEELAEPRFTTQKAERLTPYMIVSFEELIKLDIKLSNLPRAARVIFNVYYAPRNDDQLASDLSDLMSVPHAKAQAKAQGASAQGTGARTSGAGGGFGRHTDAADVTANIAGVASELHRQSQAQSLGQGHGHGQGQAHSQSDSESEDVGSPTEVLRTAAGSSNAGARRQQRRKQRGQGHRTRNQQADMRRAIETRTAHPIGWAGITLFDFDQLLRTGHLRLKLFPGEAGADTAAVATLLSNNTRSNKDTVDFLEVELPSHDKPVIYTDYLSQKLQDKEQAREEAETDRNLHLNKSSMYKLMKKELSGFIHKDSLEKLTRDQKLLVLQTRRELMADDAALPKFLSSIDWSKRAQIQMAYSLLNRWAVPDVHVALQLLDHKHPDPKVRALAVASLEALSDDELARYMLQLAQVLKFERFVDSALSRFLLRRALQSPQAVGHQFYWLLKSDMHKPEVADRYGALLDSYLRHCRTRSQIGHEMFVISRLQALSEAVKDVKAPKRAAFLKQSLQSMQEGLPESFRLPLFPKMAFKGFNVDNCRIMNSKKLPIWLELIPAHPPGAPPVQVLYKQGDHLLQDQLTLQILRAMDSLWKDQDLDLRLSIYGCVSTGDQTGFIEIVPNAETIARITAGKTGNKIAKAVRVFSDKKLKRFLANSSAPRKVTEANFMHSVAGYCVFSYVLGIGDRHNDNIMLTKDGHFAHIDFGHTYADGPRLLLVHPGLTPLTTITQKSTVSATSSPSWASSAREAPSSTRPPCTPCSSPASSSRPLRTSAARHTTCCATTPTSSSPSFPSCSPRACPSSSPRLTSSTSRTS